MWTPLPTAPTPAKGSCNDSFLSPGARISSQPLQEPHFWATSRREWHYCAGPGEGGAEKGSAPLQKSTVILEGKTASIAWITKVLWVKLMQANCFSPWCLGNTNTWQWSETYTLLCRCSQLSQQQADTWPARSQGNNLGRELIWKKWHCRMANDWAVLSQRCAMGVAASTFHVPDSPFEYYQQMTLFKWFRCMECNLANIFFHDQMQSCIWFGLFPSSHL